jgi:hypothetical protein
MPFGRGMGGQGSPRNDVTRRIRQHATAKGIPPQLWMAACCLCALWFTPRCAADDVELRLRVAWGGGELRQWSGVVRIEQGTLSDLNDLGLAVDAPGSKAIVDRELRLVGPSPTNYDSLDMTVRGPPTAELVLEMFPADRLSEPVKIRQPLSRFIGGHDDIPLDDRGNRLLIRRAPGDRLRVVFARQHLVFAPGDDFAMEIQPHLLGLEANASLRWRVQLLAADTKTEVWSAEENVRADDQGRVPLIRPSGLQIPDQEGVYDVLISLYRRSRIDVPGWRSGPFEQRKVQLVVIDSRAPPPDMASWREERTIDPTNPGWRSWASRLPGMSLLPGFNHTKPLGVSESKPVTHLGSPMLEISPQQWQAFPIPVSETGVPYILEVEYPNHLPQTLGISVVEPNAAGQVIPVGLDSAVHVPSQIPGSAPAIERHRLVFWPRTTAPLVVLTNHHRNGPAVFGRIRIYRGPRQLPAAPFADVPGQRLLAAYFDKPLFPANFSAGGEFDAPREQELDDWGKFYHGTRRLAEYLKFAGYNGAVVCVARDAGAIYPSQILQPTARFDTGVFFTTGQDPVRKDVLEMMYRIFDREGLQLIPAIHFSGRVLTLEQMRRSGAAEMQGITLVDFKGRRAAVEYNPLDPHVQLVMREVYRELTDRYGQHAAFVGAAMQLGPDSYSLLPDVTWGLDRLTVARFRQSLLADAPVEATYDDPLRPEQILQDPQLQQRWLQWRAAELAHFHMQLSDTLRRARGDARLWLMTADLFQGRGSQRLLQPTLTAGAAPNVAEAALQLGIEARQYERYPGVILSRPQRLASTFALNDQAVNVQFATSGEPDIYFHGAEGAAARRKAAVAFFHESIQLRLPSFDSVSPFGAERTQLELFTHAAPAGAHNRQRLIHALATLDAQDILDGGLLLPLGQEDALLPVTEAYRMLPRAPFQLVVPRSEARTQPVVVRQLAQSDRLIFYVVNDSPWPVTVSLELAGIPNLRIFPLGSRSWPDAASTLGRHSWNLSLEPYDIVVAWASDPRAQVVDWRTQVPPAVTEAMASRIRDVSLRADAALSREPLLALSNADFEIPGSDKDIPGWQFKTAAGLQVSLDSRDKHSGRNSLYLRSEGETLWVRSNGFKPPATGRLYVLVRLKTREAQHQPRLRVVLDDDGYFYWPLDVGAGNSLTPLPDRWTENFLFPFENLPVDRLEKLKIGFDLMDQGEVWIDEIQLYDVWIQAKERNALRIASGLANKNLVEYGNVSSCQQFLDSFWPQFLLNHVTPSTSPLDDVPPVRTAAQPPRADETAAPPEEKKSTMDRVRDMIPSVPFKVPFQR